MQRACGFYRICYTLVARPSIWKEGNYHYIMFSWLIKTFLSIRKNVKIVMHTFLAFFLLIDRVQLVWLSKATIGWQLVYSQFTTPTNSPPQNLPPLKVKLSPTWRLNWTKCKHKQHFHSLLQSDLSILLITSSVKLHQAKKETRLFKCIPQMIELKHSLHLMEDW